MIERGEEEQLDNLGFKLGLFIERELKLPYSLFVLPQDLALISASVYMAEYLDDIVFTTPVTEDHIHRAVERYNPQIFSKYFDKNGLLNSYPNLIGHGDYSKGKLAKALMDAPQNLTPTQNSWLEKELAEYFARYAKLHPGIIHTPAVSFDFSSRESAELRFESFLHSINPISKMVEYAPGLRSLKRIPGELLNIGQSTFIESNKFIRNAIAAGSKLAGLTSAQVQIGQGEFVDASLALVTNGLREKVDLVLFSGFPCLDSEELKKGLQDAYHLLRPGGFLALSLNVRDQGGEEFCSTISRLYIRHLFKDLPVVQDKQSKDVHGGKGGTLYQELYIK